MHFASLTVLLATYNGSKILGRTLEGYSQAKQADLDWQIVVVNNASNDDTPAVLTEFADRLPLVVVDEPKPGKNTALNRGLREADSAFYVITDDDAIPEPDFLQQWSAVSREHPDFDLFAGRIDPLFETPVPEWLSAVRRHFDVLYAENCRPEGPIPASRIFGPNMAVRRAVFDAGFRFCEDIGPNSGDKRYGMGSETEFCVRVERDGGRRAWFAAGPRVRHIVRPHQLSPEFVFQRAYRHGRGFAQQVLAADGRPPPPNPFQLARQRLSHALLKLRARSPLEEQRVLAKWDLHWRSGYNDTLAAAPRSGGRPFLSADSLSGGLVAVPSDEA